MRPIGTRNVDPLVAELRNSFAKQTALQPRSNLSGGTESLPEPISRAVFRHIDHKSALVLSGRRNEASVILARDLPSDQVRATLDGLEALRP